MKCKSCDELVFKRRVRDNNNICPNCGEYFFLTAEERFEMLIDEGTFVDISKSITADDPLEFTDRISYKQRIKEAQKKTGEKEAIVVGKAFIRARPVIRATPTAGSSGSTSRASPGPPGPRRPAPPPPC